MTLVLTASFGTGSSVGCLYDEDHMELESALMTSDIWMQTDNVTGSNGKRKHWPEQESEQLKRTRTEDTDCIPRRRVPLMWCPRMRWKDERRKVLKMSVNKLRRIDDPESYLRRSVLINNTVRKLQAEIRQERCTHQTNNSTSPKSKSWGFDSQPPEDEYPGRSRSLESKEDSCDEIFGIHEDFLRITIPDRCSPTPEVHNNNSNTNKGSSITTRSCTRNRTPSGNQCATQYRTVQDFLANDSRQVSHFDNVVYHSLLASLES